MPFLQLRTLPLLTMLAIGTVAHAGSVGAINANLQVLVNDGAGHAWDLSPELASLLDADAAKGLVSLAQPSAALSTATGYWMPNDSTVVNVNGQSQTITGLSWHSWQTVSGAIDRNGAAAPTNSADPWATKLFITKLQGQVDPEMSYGFYFKNNTAGTLSYVVNYGETIAPTLTGAYQISADISGAMTNTDGSTAVAPTAGALIQHLQLSSDNGATFVNAGVDVGPGASGGAGSSVYGPFSASASGTAPLAGYNYWNFNTQFSLSGKKDVFVANGSAVITPVPEPASEGLLIGGLGLIGLVILRRRAR